MTTETTTPRRGAAIPDCDPAWAWAPYVPDAKRPWDLHLAGHLLRRTGFGATWPELRQALADGPQKTIDTLLHPAADPVAAFEQKFAAVDADLARSGSSEGLRAWWLLRMLRTPQPLVEMMTLFWHGHFAATQGRVEDPDLMYRYVKLLRSHALGRFDRLLEAVVCEPAVLVSLDGAANRRAAPSRSFAAAVLGPFTLGEGQCSDSDVREAARAMTGQFVGHGQFRFVQREHDTGVKTVLGETGDWNTSDVVRIVLRQPAVAKRIVGKLYRWLISEAELPSDALLQPLAASLAEDYDIGKLVERMLRSNWFFSPAAYRQRVKGPVEFALGVLRPLESSVPTAVLAEHLAALGQDLFHPPTVHGWEGGRAWINRATLAGRRNLAQAIFAGGEPFGDAPDPWALVQKYGQAGTDGPARFLADIFLQSDTPAAVVAGSPDRATGQAAPQTRSRRLAFDIVTLPEFQLS